MALEQLPVYKCILIGNYGAGKTSFFWRFKNERFLTRGDMVDGETIDQCDKEFAVDGNNMKLQLWDTLGLERTSSLGEAYFHGSRGVLFVYNMADTSSATALVAWYDDVIQRFSGSHMKPPFFIIGTQSDRKDIVVKTEDLKEHFQSEDIEAYFEVSSCTGNNFDECVNQIVKSIYQKTTGAVPNPLPMDPNAEPKKPWWKCW